MAFKLINATEAKPGITILVDGVPCTVRSQDISKTGKHGHAKVRMDAIGIFDGKKRVLVIPGHERLEVPLIEKKKAQVLSVKDNKASVMNLESFETLEVDIGEGLEIEEGKEVEYWEFNQQKVIKRTL